ncbi:MAG: hypothetical protein P8179_07700 [Candidatus Thiodiazotropha sp.]
MGAGVLVGVQSLGEIAVGIIGVFSTVVLAVDLLLELAQLVVDLLFTPGQGALGVTDLFGQAVAHSI